MATNARASPIFWALPTRSWSSVTARITVTRGNAHHQCVEEGYVSRSAKNSSEKSPTDSDAATRASTRIPW
jgi:hypothetical protein